MILFIRISKNVKERLFFLVISFISGVLILLIPYYFGWIKQGNDLQREKQNLIMPGSVTFNTCLTTEYPNCKQQIIDCYSFLSEHSEAIMSELQSTSEIKFSKDMITIEALTETIDFLRDSYEKNILSYGEIIELQKNFKNTIDDVNQIIDSTVELKREQPDQINSENPNYLKNLNTFYKKLRAIHFLFGEFDVNKINSNGIIKVSYERIDQSKEVTIYNRARLNLNDFNFDLVIWEIDLCMPRNYPLPTSDSYIYYKLLDEGNADFNLTVHEIAKLPKKELNGRVCSFTFFQLDGYKDCSYDFHFCEIQN